MRVVENGHNPVRTRAISRFARLARNGLNSTLRALAEIWNVAFPPRVPVPPDGSPPLISKAQALREGAKLSEDVDAVSNKHVA